MSSSFNTNARVCALYLIFILATVATGILALTATQDVGAHSGFRKQVSTRAPQPGASSITPATIRQISLTTKDLVYDPVGQKIYASLPGSASSGNSIVQ